MFRPREIVRIDRAAGMGQSARRKRAIEKEQTGKTNAKDETSAATAVEEVEKEEEEEEEKQRWWNRRRSKKESEG